MIVTTYDNQPPMADWITCTGHRCAGCDSGPNACAAIAVLPGNLTCCNMCTHGGPTDPLVWAGDDN